MRSPWFWGVAVLAWLAVCGWLVQGATAVLGVWALGLALAAFCTPIGWKTSAAVLSRPVPDLEAAGATSSPGPKAPAAGPLPMSHDRAADPNGPPAGGPSLATLRPSVKPTQDREVLSAEEVAAWLEVDVEEVIAMMQAGQMPGNVVGVQWRCHRESLRRWIDGSWTAVQQSDR